MRQPVSVMAKPTIDQSTLDPFGPKKEISVGTAGLFGSSDGTVLDKMPFYLDQMDSSAHLFEVES